MLLLYTKIFADLLISAVSKFLITDLNSGICRKNSRNRANFYKLPGFLKTGENPCEKQKFWQPWARHPLPEK